MLSVFLISRPVPAREDMSDDFARPEPASYFASPQFGGKAAVRAARRLEGWPLVRSRLWPSFEVRAPQDEVCGFKLPPIRLAEWRRG
jgi:hypothetical protein